MSKRFDLVGDVRRSIEIETGEPTPRYVADVWVDRMCDAFVMAAEGESMEYAVRAQPDVARHLAHRWKGESGRKLRAAIAAVGGN